MAAKFKKSKPPMKKKQKRPRKTDNLQSDEPDADYNVEDQICGVNLGDFQQDTAVDDNDDYNISDEDEETGESQDENLNDVMEALEVENDVQSRKRKLPEGQNGSENSSSKTKKKKKSRVDLQKPPTAQEVARLKETENLFHSSLFRLQIDEMLNELSIKKKRISSFSDWFCGVQKSLTGMKVGKQYELMDQKWLQKMRVSMPLIQHPNKLKGSFNFLPPKSVSIVGSYAIGCSLGPCLNVDIAVEMPSECFQGSDHLNCRYLRKRALYLCCIVSHLRTAGVIACEGELGPHFELPQAGNPLVPVAVVVPSGSLQVHAKVFLHITVPEGTFKLAKFGPSKNSVRSKWFFDEPNADSENDFATPLQNASILSDLVAKRNETLKCEMLQDFKNLKDGIILLKVWLRQRELDRGFSTFGSHLMTMLVVYLLRCRKISQHMSSYQVARAAWNYLKECSWSIKDGGLTLCDKPPAGAPALSEFHNHYEVVFVDFTGYCNLAAHLDTVSLRMIKAESALAIQYLDNPSINSFQALFMKPAPFYRRYDHVLCFHNIESLSQMNEKEAPKEEKLDKSQHPMRLAADLLLKVLLQGLGKRVAEWGIRAPGKLSWKVEESPQSPMGPLLIGIKLDPEHAYSILDKGPPADLPEAKEFRKFWGEKSELRRFQDGSISEAAVWLLEKDVTLSRRRLVNRFITDYLLQNKLGLNPQNSMVYLANQLEAVFIREDKPTAFKYGSGEEASLAVLSSLDRLSSQLRAIPDLPLDISGVQGSSPVCRFADVFPPLSTNHYNGPKKIPGNCVLLKTGEKSSMTTPSWISPVEVIVQLALSGKWPDDAQAVRRVRAAFNIKIAECLQTQYSLTAQAFSNYVDVLKDGFIFRLRVAYQREPGLLRQSIMPDGMMKIVDCKEARALDKVTNHLPKITSYLHGLHQQQPAFGPAVCLAKRWLSGHMIRWTHFPEEVVELLMASVFLNPEPFSPPAQPQIAFLRYLHLLSSTNWYLEPLILNFNNEMDKDTISDVERRFSSERTQLPALFIATPPEHDFSFWSKEAPSLVILARVAHLAAESLTVLQSCYVTTKPLETNMWKQVFRPSLDSYNLLIHLESNMNPRRSQWIDAKIRSTRSVAAYSRKEGEKLPVIGYDPVQFYLQELETAYDEYALFFHDVYGGNVIGVVWKPSALQAKDFKISHINGRKQQDGNVGSMPQLILNREALLEDFYTIGQGLVTSIEVRDSSV